MYAKNIIKAENKNGTIANIPLIVAIADILDMPPTSATKGALISLLRNMGKKVYEQILFKQ